jgi:uroporphyrinogen-III synthase
MAEQQEPAPGASPSGNAPARWVLITRPAAAAAQTARQVSRLGYTPVLAPLLQIARLPAVLPDPAELQAVLVTSARALPALDPAYHRLPLLAVGDATAAAARAAGHVCVASAAGNAEDLLQLVHTRCDPAGGQLLLLSGRDEGGVLAGRLRQHFAVVHCFVYVAEPAAALPAAATAALRRGSGAAGEGGAALFFSAATARTFVTLAEAAGLRDTVSAVTALAISPETAAALAVWPWRAVRVARRPNQDELLDLLR